MLFRMLGTLVTFAIVGYLIYSFFGSGSAAKKAINANPAMKEQQQTLKNATGVDATDQKALSQYAIDQAKQIQQYQNQPPPQ